MVGRKVAQRFTGKRKRGSYVFEVVVTDTSSDDTKTSVSFRQEKVIYGRKHIKRKAYTLRITHGNTRVQIYEHSTERKEESVTSSEFSRAHAFTYGRSGFVVLVAGELAVPSGHVLVAATCLTFVGLHQVAPARQYSTNVPLEPASCADCTCLIQGRQGDELQRVARTAQQSYNCLATRLGLANDLVGVTSVIQG